jgi:hypothetical protein
LLQNARANDGIALRSRRHYALNSGGNIDLVGVDSIRIRRPKFQNTAAAK